MKKIVIAVTLLGVNLGIYSQVPNTNESDLPSEGNIQEANWGNYLLSNNTTSRTLRIGVSNDGYTRGEIEIENNNSVSSEIKFKTTNKNGGASQRMIIKDNGNIGIGTSNPTYKLEVNGPFALKNGNTDLLLYRDQDVGDWSLLRTNTGNGIGLIGQPDNVALSVSRTTSNVGIGTTNPTRKFDVNGDVVFNKKGSSYTHFQLGHDSNDMIISDNSPNQYYGGGYFFRVHNDAIAHKYIDVMMLSNQGNVGIGTNAPDAKLTVKGKIHTQEVKVDLAGAVAPDYVFLENYNLKTIEEVADHIQEKGHLPNIPSAKKMEEEGINLKEMNLKLLEKIEELTLYTIDQEKRIKGQESNNKDLKNKIIELENQNKRIKTLEEKLELILKKIN